MHKMWSNGNSVVSGRMETNSYHGKKRERQRQPSYRPRHYYNLFVGFGIVALVIYSSIHAHLSAPILKLSSSTIGSLATLPQKHNHQNNKNATNIAYAISITECDPRKRSGKFLLDGAAILKHSIHLNSVQTLESGSIYNYTMIAFVYDDNSSNGSPTSTTNGTTNGTTNANNNATNHLKTNNCVSQLQSLGYHVTHYTKLPVPLQEIQNEWYRERVQKGGCCQEKEFLKLYSYTLIQYPIVVHLDVDSLILKPLDDLFNVMLLTSSSTSSLSSGAQRRTSNALKEQQEELLRKIKPMWYNNSHMVGVSQSLVSNATSTKSTSTSSSTITSIDAFFTRDYNMITPSHFYRSGKSIQQVGVQGGFLVIKPSMDVYQDYQQLIRYGNYTSNNGWGDLGYGKFYGGVTVQGLVGYYYAELYNNNNREKNHGDGTAMELHRCHYNQMVDNPYQEKDGITYCRTNQSLHECPDCRQTSFQDIYSIHFTICQKPWTCMRFSDSKQHRDTNLCSQFHRRWFQIRYSFEQSWQQTINTTTPNKASVVPLPPWRNESDGSIWDPSVRSGYCGNDGRSRIYTPIEFPTDR